MIQWFAELKNIIDITGRQLKQRFNVTERGNFMKVNIFGKWVRCMNFAHASALVNVFIASSNMGSNEWYSKPGTGNIVIGKSAFAHVSYNGRVWEGIDDNIVPRKEIVF